MDTTEIGISGNREYKDTLFRKIFGAEHSVYQCDERAVLFFATETLEDKTKRRKNEFTIIFK